MYGFELAELIKKIPWKWWWAAAAAVAAARASVSRRTDCTQLLSDAAWWIGGREATSQ